MRLCKFILIISSLFLFTISLFACVELDHANEPNILDSALSHYDSDAEHNNGYLIGQSYFDNHDWIEYILAP